MYQLHKSPGIETFGDLFDLYIELYAKPFTKSWRNTVEYYNRHVRGRWGNCALSTISRLDVQVWVNSLGESSGHPTANRAFTVFCAALNWAERKGYAMIPDRPHKGIDLFRPEYRERFLQPSEIAGFLAAVDSCPNPDIKDFVWLCLLTGARKSNVLAMEWPAIEWDCRYWRIPSDQSKSGKPMLIVLSKMALELLHARAENRSSERWVFPSRSECGHLRWPGRAWRNILKRAQIADLRIHDLRRSVGSYLAINGASSYIIGKALGHTDPRSTAIYARLNLDPVRTAVQELDSIWNAARAEQ